MRARDLETLNEILHNRGRFGHREHLELAWTYLDRYPVEVASNALAAAIRHVAALHGAPQRYHVTMTQAWVRLVAVHRAGRPARAFDRFITENPRLLDKTLLVRHYSPELIASDQARTHWTEPDFRALPAIP
jgi:hypothetical protein